MALNQSLSFDTSSVTSMFRMFRVRSSPCPAPNLQSSPPPCTLLAAAVARHASRSFTPRPVTYTADGYPIKPPSCDPQAGGKVLRSEADGKEMINFGRFNDSYYGVGKGSLFIPVQRPNVSNIFEFHWCPDQNEFQVTVFKKGGPYLFRPQSPEVETLEAEKAFMQAEIDQLKADNIQLQANNTQFCVALPPSSPSPPPTEDTCTDEATDFTCKKGKCKKKYSAEKKQQCKKTCDLCDALPPSAPPPSAPEDECAGLEDHKKCKIKNCEDSKKKLKKCKKQCKKKKLKKKCKKTCCDAGF